MRYECLKLSENYVDNLFYCVFYGKNYFNGICIFEMIVLELRFFVLK